MRPGGIVLRTISAFRTGPCTGPKRSSAVRAAQVDSEEPQAAELSLGDVPDEQGIRDRGEALSGAILALDDQAWRDGAARLATAIIHIVVGTVPRRGLLPGHVRGDGQEQGQEPPETEESDRVAHGVVVRERASFSASRHGEGARPPGEKAPAPGGHLA